MSATLPVPETDKIYKKAFHRRHDSDDELDVFEAARYFSGYNEQVSAAATFSQNVLREDRDHHHCRQQHQARRGARISLDIPNRDSSMPQPSRLADTSIDPKQLVKEKNYKQPSSPGGRLASFLNSLFSQSGTKKKSSSSKSVKDDEEEESSGGGRRKQRRSSISHFRSASSTTTTTTDSSSKSLYSSSSSGFRTPPPYSLNTSTKAGYNDFRSYSDNKHNKDGGQPVPLQPTGTSSVAALLQNNNEVTFSKFQFINHTNGTYPEKQKESHWVSSEDQKETVRKFDETVDDGAESDSSSDLFELTNYDLGIYSSGLPVYETTHMKSIKRGAPISNGAL